MIQLYYSSVVDLVYIPLTHPHTPPHILKYPSSHPSLTPPRDIQPLPPSHHINIFQVKNEVFRASFLVIAYAVKGNVNNGTTVGGQGLRDSFRGCQDWREGKGDDDDKDDKEQEENIDYCLCNQRRVTIPKILFSEQREEEQEERLSG